MMRKRIEAEQDALAATFAALDAVEPELHHLTGLVTALRILGETGDSIEPVAIASLARCAGETLHEIDLHWRGAIGALRQG